MLVVMLRVGAGRFGAMLELMALDPPLPGEPAAAPATAHPSLLVADLEATLARLAARGVTPVSEILRVALPRLGTSRIAFLRDPDGHLVELVEPDEPTA